MCVRTVHDATQRLRLLTLRGAQSAQVLCARLLHILERDISRVVRLEAFWRGSQLLRRLDDLDILNLILENDSRCRCRRRVARTARHLCECFSGKGPERLQKNENRKKTPSVGALRSPLAGGLRSLRPTILLSYRGSCDACACKNTPKSIILESRPYLVPAGTQNSPAKRLKSRHLPMSLELHTRGNRQESVW